MKGQPPIDDTRARVKRADGTCNAAGKFCYRTRKKALKAPIPDGTKREAYACSHCGFWHLTSHPRS